MPDETKHTARAGVRASSSPLEAAQAAHEKQAPPNESGLNPVTSQEVISEPIADPFGEEKPFGFAAISAAPKRHAFIIEALRSYQMTLEAALPKAIFALEHPQGLNPDTAQLKANVDAITLGVAKAELLLTELSPLSKEDAG